MYVRVYVFTASNVLLLLLWLILAFDLVLLHAYTIFFSLLETGGLHDTVDSAVVPEPGGMELLAGIPGALRICHIFFVGLICSLSILFCHADSALL